MISAIVAVDENWGIGYQGQLLEHISADLKHFKELTQYNVVVMGRNTVSTLSFLTQWFQMERFLFLEI